VGFRVVDRLPASSPARERGGVDLQLPEVVLSTVDELLLGVRDAEVEIEITAER
jgi:hypothetical protein